MTNTPLRFSEFLAQEDQSPQSLKSVLELILQIGFAISEKIKIAGLAHVIGATGGTNVYGEQVQKLDELTNQLFVDGMTKNQYVYAVYTEEIDEPVYTKNEKGEYAVFFDPLDGSSNIDANSSIGTIFSIYRKSDTLLQPGKLQMVAGYIIYGPQVMIMYTTGVSVNGFTLEPKSGDFLLSHPKIQIPPHGDFYSVNEGYYNTYDKNIQTYLDSLKSGEKAQRLRFVGTMVADIHRTLIKGGIFLYPADKKNPEGKLRLMLEVNPMAYLIKVAGGLAVNGKQDVFEIVPTSLTQRVPIAIGSREDVEKFMSFV